MFKKLIKISIFVLFFASPCWAQDPSGQKVFYQLGTFRHALEGKDPVSDTYNVLDEQKQMQLQKTYNIDAETAAIIMTLKNPFESQLPKTNSPQEYVDEMSPFPEDMGPDDQYQEVTKPTFKISGLVWNSDQPQAILNGTVYTQGDVIDGWIIAGIHANGVEVSFQNQTFLIEP